MRHSLWNRSVTSARDISPPVGFLDDEIAIVYTDMVGSTVLAEQLGDAWQDLLTHHHRVVRQHFEAHQAFEAGNQGDGFLFLLPTIDDALAASRSALDELAHDDTNDVHIRIGVHRGEVGFAEDVGFFGHALHYGARIAAVANDSQILISDAALQAVRRPMNGSTLRDHGTFWLKSLAQPVPIHELVPVGSPAVQPRAQAVGSVELPAYHSPLVGRHELLAQVQEIIATRPGDAVTLCGLGGVGKTRLAVELARIVTSRPAVFVDLSPLEAPSQVLPEICRRLGIDHDDDQRLARIAAHCQDQRLLLLVDNLEQVIACAGELGEIAQRAPDATLLCTSRVPLRVANETIVDVGPLTTRAGSVDAPLPAHELFAQLARLELADSHEAIAKICELVNGLPLALELAAGRVNALGVREVGAQLASSIALLSGGHRDTPERHRTIAATVMWSHALLSPAGQRVFRRLSQFPGGATVETLRGFDDLDGDQVAIALAELVEHRLVERTGIETSRFTMLRVIREVAAAELERCGELAQTRATAGRLLRNQSRSAARLFGSPQEASGQAQILADVENYRALFDWAAADTEVLDTALAAGADLLMFWWHDHLAEGIEIMRRITALPAASSQKHQAHALLALTLLASSGGSRDEAPDLARRAVDAARRSGRRDPTLGGALQQLSLSYAAHDDSAQALATLDEMIEVANELPALNRAVLMVGAGPVLIDANQIERAEVALMSAIEVFDHGAPSWLSAAPTARLAECALRRGDVDAAAQLAVDALHRWGDSPGSNGIPRAWAGLARIRWCQGEHEAARLMIKNACRLAMEMGAYGDLPWIMVAAGAVASSADQPDSACRLFGGAESLGRSCLHPVAGVLHHELAGAVATARTGVGASAASEWETGAAMSAAQLASIVESL